MFEPHEYAITVRKVSIDGEQIFEAQVRELPYVAEYAETFEEAYQLAIDTIQTSMAMFAEKGKPFPPPSQPEEDEYSGRITLKLPKYLHRQIALAALHEELSLNQYILSLLSYRVGAETAQKLNFARAGLQLAQ
ncbi:MAG: toxin-antitoxin system HicB family antitoxin [Candidatus Parabeggiatoa sp. nov. 2]|nr:MAG: hypothetical protein B6247_24325 [Beggiatoa sp. 4572_84]RKZ62340.1 MAG: toxin-antitoxin system HicB family antitoxin [Gammaproteobacteria bacterium]HEC84908.1 toxin-antitoxin system HicB family antitoxin [Thioploca sp.]